MPTPTVKAKGLFTFGAGAVIGFGAVVALKACFPKAAEFSKGILERLGFDAVDLFHLLRNLEDSGGTVHAVTKVKAKPRKRLKAVQARRAPTVLTPG